MSFKWTRPLTACALAGLLPVAGCGRSNPASSDVLVDPVPNPASRDLLIDPIQVESVDVLVQAGNPPRASAHIRGVLGDGCSSLHSVEQERSGNTVVLTILRQRPANAICIQIARVYDDTIRLDGAFPAGAYVLRVNGTETSFVTN